MFDINISDEEVRILAEEKAKEIQTQESFEELNSDIGQIWFNINAALDEAAFHLRHIGKMDENDEKEKAKVEEDLWNLSGSIHDLFYAGKVGEAIAGWAYFKTLEKEVKAALNKELQGVTFMGKEVAV